ncbi:MAG: biopolymer transporter ExbD [Pseudomonadota bacterium]|nr:biopolymer transporter ExbD [Pseudomonadota bacterium]
MNLRTRRRESPDINLTPLIDVVFLLLIFFMVSTTFRKESDLRIDLPQADRRPLPEEQSRLLVEINAAGEYRVAGRILPDARPQTLEAALTAAAARDRPLLIRADGRTPHQAVVTVMDVAGRLGFTRQAIATVQPALPNE